MVYDLQLFLMLHNVSVCYLKKTTACSCSYDSVSTSINMLLLKKGLLWLYRKYKKFIWRIPMWGPLTLCSLPSATKTVYRHRDLLSGRRLL